MKASPQKCGHGYITSYRLIIGCGCARRCGFVDEHGNRAELETIELPEEKSVIVRVKQQAN